MYTGRSNTSPVGVVSEASGCVFLWANRRWHLAKATRPVSRNRPSVRRLELQTRSINELVVQFETEATRLGRSKEKVENKPTHYGAKCKVQGFSRGRVHPVGSGHTGYPLPVPFSTVVSGLADRARHAFFNAAARDDVGKHSKGEEHAIQSFCFLIPRHV